MTDKGSDMVIKFDPEGRVLMVFGRKQEASDEDTGPLKHPKPPLPAEDGRFRQVTDVAWDKAGNTFISDGYINSRVAKVDKDGNWLKSWGDRGKEPGQFNTPHSIATDANGNVYVADRGNHRIQVFDGDGKFLRQITIDVPVPPDAKPAIGKIPDEAMMAGGTFYPGSPWSLCITPPPNQVLYSSDAWPGRIYKLSLDGKVLGVLGQSGKQLKQFGWIHAMACPSENVLYRGGAVELAGAEAVAEAVSYRCLRHCGRRMREANPVASLLRCRTSPRSQGRATADGLKSSAPRPESSAAAPSAPSSPHSVPANTIATLTTAGHESVVDDVLQPDDEDVVQEIDAVGRRLHRIEQAPGWSRQSAATSPAP